MYIYNESSQVLEHKQAKLGAPMPWIGMYAAGASLICSLLMASDVIRGFRHKKIRLPCKFFTLNATSLTLLSVAMKLPLDLSTYMPTTFEQLAKLSGVIFMCTSMANFMPSLGPMGKKELLTNVTALGILVITLSMNIFIESYTGAISIFRFEHALVTSLMLLLFVMISFSALMIPISKEILEIKYLEKHEMEEVPGNTDELGSVDKLKDRVKKYWMMAETGGPQFVITRTATCSASGSICFITILILVKSWLSKNLWDEILVSDYSSSITFIMFTQSIGAVIGTIAPVFRWFTVISFKSSKKVIKGYYRNTFKVEHYWIQMLVQWKEIPSGLAVRARICEKLFHNTKNMVLDICIGVQMVIVVASKIVRLVPIFLVTKVLRSICCCCCKESSRNPVNEPTTTSVNQRGSDSRASAEVDFSRYVLQLKDDEQLPERILNNISNSANHFILVAQKQQPKNLFKLLDKFAGIKAAPCLKNGQVPRLHLNDKPNFWSLSLITTTCIAIALPKVKKSSINRLLSSVREGMIYVRLVEKSLDTNGDLVNMGSAADIVWLGVELYRKWLDDDLRKIALKGKTFVEILQQICDTAKKRDEHLKRETSEDSEANRPNWQIKGIAVNSMYEVCRTLLTEYEGSQEQTYENLFEQLSVMIAYILCDCFAKLPQVIYKKCYCSEIERREESVQQAARLLGETEEIIKILQQNKTIPSLELDVTSASV